MNKAHIRALALQQRQALRPDQRHAYSQHIIESLLQHLSAQAIRPESLLIYRSTPSEVATDTLLQNTGYRMFAPVTQADASMQWLNISPTTAWQKGVFGVLEPEYGDTWQPQCGSTTLLCPLSAFDRQGNRLGMGKGCFDTWLSQYGDSIQQVIGLAFSCQEVAHVPTEPHDINMDMVITEQQLITCSKPSRT